MKSIVELCLNKLKRNDLTLACAEASLGGLLGQSIVAIPGASQVFRGTISTYSNQSKINILGVSDDLMDVYGAVSVEVVTQMALKVKELFQSDFVIAESGIASPIVGSQKSSGLYFIGCFSDKSSVVEQFQFEGYRDQIMNEAALHAFKILNESLVD
ncbi:MAG: CinA family protein [Dehalococcoidia bacterium]